MARPVNERIVHKEVKCDYFKPRGSCKNKIENIDLKIEELEAVRLNDLLKYKQDKSAKLMNVSQPTFHRIVDEARNKIADALINGKALKVEGGNYVKHKKCKCKQ